MDKYIIAYEQGYTNWYVSEFYKFFHKKIEEKTGITFQYLSLSELAKRFGHSIENHSDSLFNWFNLVIMNEETEKMFIHSWYDYANVTLDWCIKNQLNVSKFSCVSNLDENYLKKYSVAQPSVYYFENWGDHDLVSKYSSNDKVYDRVYFAALSHGIREHIMDRLKNYEFFNILNKRNPDEFRQKETYYEELSKHKYGLSLNGAANICYRDLELFGLGNLNIRQKLTCNTYNPLLPNVHYIEFIDDAFLHKIITNQNIDNEIKDKIDFLSDFYNTKECSQIIENSKEWYVLNCLPDNQFNILYSFLDELTILD
jgi:hypothetical protein